MLALYVVLSCICVTNAFLSLSCTNGSFLRLKARAGSEKPSYPSFLPKNAREMAKFSNKIPFNDAVYEQITFSIRTISGRMVDKVIQVMNPPHLEHISVRSNALTQPLKMPLDVETLDKLDIAIEGVLKDAHTFGPPKRPS